MLNHHNMAKTIGLAMVFAGALALIISYLTHYTSHNWVLLGALALVVAGIVGYVVGLKGESRY